MKKTLVVPLMTEDIHSIVFGYDKESCMINCVHALQGMDLTKFDEVCFVACSKVAKNLRLEDKIAADMQRLAPVQFMFILLDEMTSTPAETAYRALSAIGWEGRSVFIKDGDNSFECDVPAGKNALIISSIEKLDLVDPIHKSYIRTDEQGFITNCIEKRVVSDKFIAGGYSFADAKLFKEGYDALKKLEPRFYISDIIYWLILMKREKFLPTEANNFVDFNVSPNAK